MSHRHPLDRPLAGGGQPGRGRAATRRAHVAVDRFDQGRDRDQFRRRWSLLMIGTFSSREHCAVHFGVSFQTACNWFDGLACPYGHIVDRATRELPRYHDVMGCA